MKSNTAVLNIAHRGARAYAPENTLIAFAKALTFACDMVELDVRLSKDGEIVVYHDEHLLRCTDAKAKYPDRGNYQVSDFTVAELSILDAGSWYVEQLSLENEQRQAFLQSLTDAEMVEFVSVSEREFYASGTIKIPTLTEALDLATELGLMVNVELKKTEDGQHLVNTVLQLIKTMNLEDKILISSFEHDLLTKVRQQNKTITTAILVDEPIKAPVTYLRNLKANAYNFGTYHHYKQNGFGTLPGRRYLSQISKIKKSRFGLNVWTCNDPGEMRYLLNAGVTGIISDFPNRVRAELNRYLTDKDSVADTVSADN